MSENNKRNPEYKYTTDLEYTCTSRRDFTPMWHDQLPHLEFYGVVLTAENWPNLRAVLDEWITHNAAALELFPVAIRAWAEIEAGAVTTDEIQYPDLDTTERALWFER